MKRIILFLFLLQSCAAYAQRVDTLYYDRAGQIARNTPFADYYRIALYPADSTGRKEFRDFYNSGELRREGYFLSIDSLDDCKTVLDGALRTYFRDGSILEESCYANGRLHGEYRRYTDEGALSVEAFYYDGELSGAYKAYDCQDGSCRIVEYVAGKPLHDYYLLSDDSGNTLKFRISDDMPVWESPIVAERFVDCRDGVPWEVYFKNGITLALTNSVVRDYGKWHRIDLVISNNSTTPVEFVPERDIAAYSMDDRGMTSDLSVWSCDAYMKKVKRAQTWAAIAMGFSEGLASAGAGYSTSTTSGYSSRSGRFSYTTTTYDAGAAYRARMASQQRLASFGQALQEEKNVKQMGYLKQNTIYPGESVSGYVLVEWLKGERVFFFIGIEDAEYLYEWRFDKKAAYPIK